MESAVNKQLGFDPSTVKRLTVLEILKRIGPGIILAGVVVGPGAITTAAMLVPAMDTICCGCLSPSSS